MDIMNNKYEMKANNPFTWVIETVSDRNHGDNRGKPLNLLTSLFFM